MARAVGISRPRYSDTLRCCAHRAVCAGEWSTDGLTGCSVAAHAGSINARLRRWIGRLIRVRDRVLAGARLRRGMTVVDVGAGTGLLALDAARRVGESGRVVALDVSYAALVECRRPQRSGDPLDAVVGDAVSLPLSDQCAEAVVTRSALIYVVDKAACGRRVPSGASSRRPGVDLRADQQPVPVVR